MLVFLSYLGSLYRPLRQLSKLAYVSSRGVASAERISEILEAESDVRDVRHAAPAPRFLGHVEFKTVVFSYTPGQPVLYDIELEAAPGEMVAIVGPTGAGKSTLVSLIPRFFDPLHGRVVIDGFNVRDLELRSLRAQIAIVPQEPILFEGTIFANIAYGRPSAAEPDVVRAAEAALVDQFVRRLPDGYETVVGERGATLSGGERQRISIARVGTCSRRGHCLPRLPRDGGDASRIVVPGTTREDPAPCSPAERGASVRPLEDGEDLLRQVSRIARLVQEPGPAVSEELRGLAGAGGDDRPRHRHRLEQFERREVATGLRPVWDDDDVHRSKDAGNVGVGNCSGERQVRLAELEQVAQAGPVADDQKLDAIVGCGENPGRRQQRVQVVPPPEAADESHDGLAAVPVA